MGEGRHAVVVHGHRIAVGKDAANDAEGPVMEAMRQRENRERRQAGKAGRDDVFGVARDDWRQRSVAEPPQVPSARRQGGARAQAIERGETQHGAAGGEPERPRKRRRVTPVSVTSWHAPSLSIHGRNLLIRDRILADVAGLGVADVDDRNEERPEYGPSDANVKLSRAVLSQGRNAPPIALAPPSALGIPSGNSEDAP